MFSARSLRLPALAVGVAAAGALGLQLLERLAPATATAPISGGTHAETQPHAPNIQSAGNYHIEAQLDPSGALTLYIYGQREKQLAPLDTAGLETGLEVWAICEGEGRISLPMRARPYPTDPTGTASRFVGRFARRPDQIRVGLSLTVPIDGRTYRVQWRPEDISPGPSGDGAAAMPVAASSDEAQRLFLTPGGVYTPADIAANGRMTATQKYGDQMSSHNPHPAPGDRICPITDTLANPRFAWTVGGKIYLFCCPPCIEEFVRKAKTAPGTIRAPEAYIQPS
jgi:hypothetical protein